MSQLDLFIAHAIIGTVSCPLTITSLAVHWLSQLDALIIYCANYNCLHVCVCIPNNAHCHKIKFVFRYLRVSNYTQRWSTIYCPLQCRLVVYVGCVAGTTDQCNLDSAVGMDTPSIYSFDRKPLPWQCWQWWPASASTQHPNRRNLNQSERVEHFSAISQWYK